ncbi:hypothetical protein [Kineosporia babensis]|uniref:Uncharacterized protein n=1 Tax=Kineosporia babensis TaxID=499548 RepID=A0A9X1SRL4_9ACTN|nr:hypothetical protein [Kineosporia babensis]MCD5309729.1 hypothetical protein [Kineosporia babensis]
MISRDVRRIGLVLLVGLAVVAVAATVFLRSDGLARWRGGGEELAVQEATDRYLAQTPERGEPVASAQGVIYALNSDNYQTYEDTGTLDILAVDVSKTSTHVRFVLSAESEHALSRSRYADGGDAGFRTAVLTAGGQTVRSAQWTGAAGGSWDCTCGRFPETVGPSGIEMSLLFPALPESVDEVQLSIPGFAPLTAPVER